MCVCVCVCVCVHVHMHVCCVWHCQAFWYLQLVMTAKMCVCVCVCVCVCDIILRKVCMERNIYNYPVPTNRTVDFTCRLYSHEHIDVQYTTYTIAFTQYTCLLAYLCGRLGLNPVASFRLGKFSIQLLSQSEDNKHHTVTISFGNSTPDECCCRVADREIATVKNGWV